MANGLISGFQTGLSAFKPYLESKLRMKELAQAQKHQTSERKDTQEFAKGERVGTQKFTSEESQKLFGHQRDLAEDKMAFDSEMQKNLFYHQETMQRNDLSSQEKLQRLAQEFKKTDNAAARAASLKMLREQIKATSQEKGLDRNQVKLLSKLDRQLKKSEGKADRAVQRDLSKDTTKRAELGIASNEKMQGQRIEAEKESQGREFGQRDKEQKFGARADRKAQKLSSRLAKELTTHREDLAGSRVGRVALNMGKLRADYHKGMAAINTPGMSEKERMELQGHLEALRDIIITTNNTANTITEGGNVADLDKLMEWFDTGEGPRPNTGMLPRTAPRPADSWGGGGGFPTINTQSGGFGNNQGRNQRVGEALGGGVQQIGTPSAVPAEYQNRLQREHNRGNTNP